MDDPSCVILYNFLWDEVMGYISQPKVLSSWMLSFWPYNEKRGEVLYNALWSLHLWTSADLSAAHHHLFSCWLLSISPAITMLWKLILCCSLFPLSHYASLAVFSMDILNSSTNRLVKSVKFANAPSSSTLTRFHGCC